MENINATDLLNYLTRIERLLEEKKQITEDINEVYAQAKSQGYDPKVMKIVIKLRAMAEADKTELDMLTETYRNTINV